jgi:hypothetical protein
MADSSDRARERMGIVAALVAGLIGGSILTGVGARVRAIAARPTKRTSRPTKAGAKAARSGRNGRAKSHSGRPRPTPVDREPGVTSTVAKDVLRADRGRPKKRSRADEGNDAG